MYPPQHHQENDFTEIKRVIDSFPLATLISQHEGEIFTTHLPLFWYDSAGEFGKLVGHIDKNNPQIDSFKNGLIIIFHATDTYISPTVYQSSGKLPTWNYIKVHVKGRCSIVEDSEEVKNGVIEMTQRLEMGKSEQFELLSDNKAMRGFLPYIVGFEIEIESVEGKFKLSQDKNETDKQNAMTELFQAPITRHKKYLERK